MTGIPPSSPPPPVRASVLLVAFLGLLFCLPAFLFFRPAAQPTARAANAVKHGFIQLDNEEGALLFQAMQIRRGESIYRPLTAPPYVAGTYAPLYMASVAAVDDFKNPGFARGRTIVWLSALAAAALLVTMVLSVTRNPVLGLLAGFLFLGTWEVYRWIGYFRVDFPAMALSLAGLAVVVLSRRAWWQMVVAAFFMTAALYTRQTMLAAPAACFCALLLSDRKKAFGLLALMLLWGLPPLLALHFMTDGQFLRHIILYNANTSHAHNLLVWWNHIQFMHPLLLAAAGVGLAVFLMHASRAVRAPRPETLPADTAELPPAPLAHFWSALILYALFAQWNFFAIAKAGSAENYLLEPIAGWAILACVGAGYGLRAQLVPGGRGYKIAGLVAVAAIFCAITAHGWRIMQPQEFLLRFNPQARPSTPDFQAANGLTGLMRDAENPMSELAIYSIRTGHPPVLQPFIMSELARQNKWDQSAFVDSIRSADYDLVITLQDVTSEIKSETYTREMLLAFRAAYEVDQVVETPLWTYYILRPKEPGTAAALEHIAYRGSSSGEPKFSSASPSGASASGA